MWNGSKAPAYKDKDDIDFRAVVAKIASEWKKNRDGDMISGAITVDSLLVVGETDRCWLAGWLSTEGPGMYSFSVVEMKQLELLKCKI